MSPDSEKNPALAHQRLRLSADLDALGIDGAPRAAMSVSDGVWKGIRAGLWLGGIPWSMMVTGVGGPGHFRIGHRGPARRIATRAMLRAEQLGALRLPDAAALGEAPDGAWVKLIGRVRLRDRLPGLVEQDAVFQRVDFKLVIITGAMTRQLFLTYEAAQDFDLECGGGEQGRVRVLVKQAAFIPSKIMRRRGQLPFSAEAVQALPMEPEVSRYLVAANIHAIKGVKSRLLQDGQKVRVVGTKGRVVDPGMDQRLFRQEPYRPALLSSPERPLVIHQRRSTR